MIKSTEHCVTKKRIFVSLYALLSMLCGLALSVAQAAVYDFEELNIQGLNDQDNWKGEQLESLGRLRVIGDTTTVNGSQVVQPIIGANSGSFAYYTRVNNATYWYSSFTGDTAVIQFDANGMAKAGFALGRDVDGNGLLDRSNGGSEGEIGPIFGTYLDAVGGNVAQFFVNEAGLNTTSPDFSPSYAVPLTTPQRCCNDPEDWYRLQLRIDLKANSGNGLGSLYYMNLTKGDTGFRPVEELQNLDMELHEMAQGAGPASWNAMWLVMRFDGGQNIPSLDNLLPVEGEGMDTAGLFDPTTSQFYLRNALAGGAADIVFPYGPPNAGWTPLTGDWDGDGMDTVGLHDPAASKFYLLNTHAGGAADITFLYGPPNAGWTPIAGDWDGDGIDTVGLFDPIASEFYLRNAHAGGAADIRFLFGPRNTGWTPIAGDWNGDGTDTVGLFDPIASEFYLRNAHAGGAADIVFPYGPPNAGWTPLTGDWDGDGMATVGLHDPAASKFYLRNTHAGGAADITFLYGPPNAGWIPIAGDWD